MMYQVKRSFIDPFTGRVWLRGKPYMVTDKMQAKYLEAHGVIEHIKVEEKAPVEQSPGADLPATEQSAETAATDATTSTGEQSIETNVLIEEQSVEVDISIENQSDEIETPVEGQEIDIFNVEKPAEKEAPKRRKARR